MSVEIKPFNGFPAAVYVDGVMLPKQTVEGPWVTGKVVKVSCLTDDRVSNHIDPKAIPYQVKPFEVHRGKSGAGTEELEITTLYLQLP